MASGWSVDQSAHLLDQVQICRKIPLRKVAESDRTQSDCETIGILEDEDDDEHEDESSNSELGLNLKTEAEDYIDFTDDCRRHSHKTPFVSSRPSADTPIRRHADTFPYWLGDNSDFDALPGPGQVQRLTVVLQRNLVRDELIHLNLSALEVV